MAGRKPSKYTSETEDSGQGMVGLPPGGCRTSRAHSATGRAGTMRRALSDGLLTMLMKHMADDNQPLIYIICLERIKHIGS